MELSIVLAAYREAENLRSLLHEIHSQAAKLTSSFEILVIDSQQSLDDTESVCAQFGVRHIRRRGGDSYVDALRTWLTEVHGEFALNMDADGSHSPADMPQLWSARHQADVVIGSRYIAGGSTQNATHLVWVSRVLNAVLQRRLGLDIQDATNSFRLYRRSVLSGIQLTGTEFDVLPELLVRLRKSGASISEVPITFSRRMHDTSKREGWKQALAYWKLLRALGTQ